jgi:hypothetical protein
MAWQHWVHKIKIDTGLATLSKQDTNRHWPGNIGYTRYKQTLTLFLSWVPNVARPMSVCILCTQCCEAGVCLYHVYTMLPGQCLFVSCVPNVARPVSGLILCTKCCQARVCMYLVFPNVARLVSVFILCTISCQASVCLYHVYPMLPDQCLFLSCLPNVVRFVSVCILWTQCCQASVCLYTRYKQTLAWQHWVHKMQTDTGLATLGT